MRRKHDDDSVRITSAQRPRSEDINGRQRRYLISMGIRTACFILAVVYSLEREHIDAWLAEHTECPSLGGRVYQLLHPCHGDAAGTRDPRKLVGRGGRRDVRIQTAARESDQVDRHRRAVRRVSRAQGDHATG